MGNPSGSNGWEPILKARATRPEAVRPGAVNRPDKSLKRLFSCGGLGTNRYGARAFSTLEGYAGRNRETESAFSATGQENARPPSRFSSEIGTKADAKQ